MWTLRTFIKLAAACCALAAWVQPGLAAEAAYVRVSQIGYEAGGTPARAYLMSTTSEAGATFRLMNSSGATLYSGAVGPLSGIWTHSKQLAYRVYALDFPADRCEKCWIVVSGPVPAASPVFAVDERREFYDGLLLNSKFFFETERDGPHYIPNALRTAPGHLNDEHAAVYQTPPLDDNDLIATTDVPLTPTGAVINAAGGWWDAGDYMKYVETVSYTVALQEIGVRDFPDQMGPGAPFHPPAPPNAISYAGGAPGSPASANFSNEANFGIQFLIKMWADRSRTLYYQVGNSQDWANFPDLQSDYDIWRLPQADDHWDGCVASAAFICHRPVFAAGRAGSKISPNLAGRLAASFALCYVLNRERDPQLATHCLNNAEQIFELADTSLADPAASVNAGSCPSGCLLTIIPFDGYPETVWDDDMELGAAELFFALRMAQHDRNVPHHLLRTSAATYLRKAALFARRYIDKVYATGNADTLNLYDLSGLAHFELYRALGMAEETEDLAIGRSGIGNQFLKQVGDAIAHAKSDPFDFGGAWNSDTASHATGLSVMASEAFALTGRREYDVYAQRWMANALGANAWGSSFITGDGSTSFPNCIQHQVANLAGALDGTSGGTPVLWGAVSEGPSSQATSGALDRMNLCPANDADRFRIFNGNQSVYQDNVQSYSTTEPAIDLSAASFLMWAWRLAGHPAY